MFPHPNGVQCSEANLHICAEITGEKASNGILLGIIPSTVHGRIAFKWKVWLLCDTDNIKSEKTMVTEQVPQVEGIHFSTAIDLTAVNVAGDDIYLCAAFIGTLCNCLYLFPVCDLPEDWRCFTRSTNGRGTFKFNAW